MTWNELSTKIASMNEAERQQSVLFRESYDDGAEIQEVAVFLASNYLFPPEVDETDNRNALIRPGQYFLA